MTNVAVILDCNPRAFQCNPSLPPDTIWSFLKQLRLNFQPRSVFSSLYSSSPLKCLLSSLYRCVVECGRISFFFFAWGDCTWNKTSWRTKSKKHVFVCISRAGLFILSGCFPPHVGRKPEVRRAKLHPTTTTRRWKSRQISRLTQSHAHHSVNKQRCYDCEGMENKTKHKKNLGPDLVFREREAHQSSATVNTGVM